MTENVVTPAAVATPAAEDRLSTEAIVRVLEDAVAADRPRRDLRLTDSISQDIRLDSLALLEVLTRVEEAFDIELIDAPEIYSAATVEDLVAVVRARAAQAATTSTAERP
ncbi:phosphopantetheine-binding protein [Streptomyces sp. NPDC029674]|uniref:phosphopantetheine-binding protein n=1 Tax=Streptomyces sp. NPDC029674 TaxID=3365297 RepID=UPI00384B8814